MKFAKMVAESWSDEEGKPPDQNELKFLGDNPCLQVIQICENPVRVRREILWRDPASAFLDDFSKSPRHTAAELANASCRVQGGAAWTFEVLESSLLLCREKPRRVHQLHRARSCLSWYRSCLWSPADLLQVFHCLQVHFCLSLLYFSVCASFSFSVQLVHEVVCPLPLLLCTVLHVPYDEPCISTARSPKPQRPRTQKNLEP